ncbi:MAG: hypothetical protein IJB32_05805 [Clostridia bacterium]|nr:hypothetical protein [Clostridia bacterium]
MSKITIDNICRLCRLHSGKKTPCETPCKEWNDLLDNLLIDKNKTTETAHSAVEVKE